MGFDNIEFAEHAATSISTVKLEVDLVTDLAVECPLQLIAAPDGLPEPRVTKSTPIDCSRQHHGQGRLIPQTTLVF